MPRVWLVCIPLLMLVACKQKAASLDGDGPVDVKDFVNAFPPLTLPFYAADTNVRKVADTITISQAVFTQFIPDSALQKFVDKQAGPVNIHPVGRIEREEEKYLVATFNQKKKTNLVAFILNKKMKYMAALQLVTNRHPDEYIHSVQINREPTFTISREKAIQQNDLRYTRSGYAYNSSAGTFIKVVDDTNEDQKKIDVVINPIDTLPRKNKYSGDYVEDKKNYISIRDGKNGSNYLFFIHFEKDDGNCTGELKGEMTMHDATKGYYQESGDPCVIDFSFEDNTITLKEQGNCGNHRGIKCYFDDTFRKKKESKPKKASK
jgi:hypothetical protein